MSAYGDKLRQAGFPLLFAGSAQAPFDVLEDFFRGSAGLMRDVHKMPKMVRKACEKLVPLILENAVAPAEETGNHRVFVSLHEHTLLCPAQFERLCWPTFRDVLIGLMDRGLTPLVWLEGDSTARLDLLRDIPDGKACYWFESVDMAKARKALTGEVCIMGGVSKSLLKTGTPEDVKSRCKEIIESCAAGKAVSS